VDGSYGKLRIWSIHFRRFLGLVAISLSLSLLFFFPSAACKKSPITPGIEELTRPIIWFDSSQISFAALAADDNPSPQFFRVKNAGKSTLDYTLTVDADWLSVEPASGSSTGQPIEHTVCVKKDGLVPQEADYSAAITISCPAAYNSPQTIGVKLKIDRDPPPEIWINSLEMTFAATVGSNPSPQTLRVKNAGQSALNYEISWDASWLNVAPANGNSNGEERTHTVSVNSAALAEGNYSGMITITDPAATNNSQKVKITLTVSKAPPSLIGLNATQLSFTVTVGQNPSPQLLGIRNSGSGTLNYQVTWDAGWLSVSPTSGSSTGQENSHAVAINSASLGAGTYGGVITVTDQDAANSPQTVTVTLNVTQALPPVITLSATQLLFTATVGQDPPSQSIGIRNSGSGTLNYQVTCNASWLSVSPASGSSTGQEKSHVVVVNSSSLGAGTYSGMITVASSAASNSPQKVSVTLEVTQAPPPVIALSTTQLSFSAMVGQNPSPQTIGIRNSGSGTLNYQVSWDAGWLSVNPASGSSTGQENSHVVTVNSSSLGAGTYNGTITVSDSAAANSPQHIVVTLEVKGPPSSNEIYITCNPSSGVTGTTVSVIVSIRGNVKQISSFGLELTFDAGLFQYQNISKGSLNGNWGMMDGNLISQGTVRIGGLAGSGSSIPTGSEGSIAVVTLKVIGTAYNDGHQSQIVIKSYADDIAGMVTEPSATVFTFRK
jgi:hypothetical protein